MIEKLPSFSKVVHELGRLPGVGYKTALRLAYFILKSPKEHSENLQKALKEMSQEIKECEKCFTFTENTQLCALCNNPHRHSEVICVVQDPLHIKNIEDSGVFSGTYHVLQGTLSPLHGVSPEDLKIKELFLRIQKQRDTNTPVKEVILALDTKLEGDTTALYLSNLLKEQSIKTSRLALGVPIGGEIDYLDQRTLGQALENRVEL